MHRLGRAQMTNSCLMIEHITFIPKNEVVFCIVSTANVEPRLSMRSSWLMAQMAKKLKEEKKANALLWLIDCWTFALLEFLGIYTN